LAACVLLALYLLTLRWVPAHEDVRTARMTTSDEGLPAELIAKAWVATNQVDRGFMPRHQREEDHG
jgi:hypothetical protein